MDSEIPFDGDLVETEFNEILEDYLNMQGRSDSDEGDSDDDDTDDSSSANDSDIGRAICTNIVGVGWSNHRCSRGPVAIHPPGRLPLSVVVPVTVTVASMESMSRGTLDASVREASASTVLERGHSSHENNQCRSRQRTAGLVAARQSVNLHTARQHD